jgi:tRNA dimethylallyltransferase
MATELPRIIVVCGPTGVGKTRFAIEAAGYFKGEIVGADSMQIYRHMDIGTAKPTPEERAAVTHHMVDIIDPDQPFDAAAYSRQAHNAVQKLLKRGILPFIVGGTGLYIKSLVYGLFDSPVFDPDIREALQDRAAREGSGVLHDELARKDPEAGERIHINDRLRIIRALEVLAATGRSITDHQQRHGFMKPRYHALFIGLTLPRDELYERINRRVDIMISEGMKDEVDRLLASGVDASLKSMQALGYRHMADYLQGRLSWEDAVRTLKRDHRRYAKRQLTWFGAMEQVHWLSPGDHQAGRQLIEKFVNGCA